MMKHTTTIIFILFFPILLHAQQQSIDLPSTLSPSARKSIQQAMDKCVGCTYKWIDAESFLVTRPDGGTHYETWRDNTEAERAFKAKHKNNKEIEIDLGTIDTAKYSKQLKLISIIPISSEHFWPAVFIDSNEDGLLEACGQFDQQDSTKIPQVRLYEATDNTLQRWVHRFTYKDMYSFPLLVADFDGNGKDEIIMSGRTDPDATAFMYRYESKGSGFYATDSLASILHKKGGNIHWPRVADLNNDGRLEFIDLTNDYRPEDGMKVEYVQVVTFDDSLKRPRQRWKNWFNAYEEGRATTLGRISINDANGNGKKELVVSAPQGPDNRGGTVFINEWTGTAYDFKEIWRGELPSYNLYVNTEADDLNDDGRKEYYVVGTVTDRIGNRDDIYRIEAVNDTTFETTLTIHIRGMAGIHGRSIYQLDVDGDGKKELLFVEASTAIILKPDGLDNFKLYWVQHFQGNTSSYAQDINKDGKDEVIIGERYPIYGPTEPKHWTFVFTNDSSFVVEIQPIVSISYVPMLLRLYPNPSSGDINFVFNSTSGQQLELEIHDLLGRLIFDKSFNLSTENVVFIWHGSTNQGSRAKNGTYLAILKLKNNSTAKAFQLIR